MVMTLRGYDGEGPSGVCIPRSRRFACSRPLRFTKGAVTLSLALSHRGRGDLHLPPLWMRACAGMTGWASP